MSYTYRIELIEKLPKCIPLGKMGSITTEDEWYGSAYGECFGKILDTGEKESFFKMDKENGNTALLDAMLASGKYNSIQRDIFNRGKHEISKVKFLYIMYHVSDHCSEKKTVTTEALDTPMNVKYEYMYEILLVADEEYKRYITVKINTDGPWTSSMMDQIESFEQMFEEWAENGDQGFRYNESEIEIKFYDTVGEENYLSFDSMSHLLMSINSIRIIELKSEIVK